VWWSVAEWSVVKCSGVLQCSDGLSNKVSNIIRRLMDNMKLLLVCILRVLLSHYFFINVYVVLFLFNNVIYVFLLYDYVYVWLPWLRIFRAFSSVVRQMPEWCPQRRGTDRTFPNFFVALCIFLCCSMHFLCCSMSCLFCDVFCIVCVYVCTEQLPPGGYPIAVKYIISYHIIYHHELSDCSGGFCIMQFDISTAKPA
jgi:hypothetical protein